MSCYRVHKSACADKNEENHAMHTRPDSTLEDTNNGSSNLSNPPVDEGSSSKASPFEILQSSPELGEIFAKYPNLRSQLYEVYLVTLQPPPDSPESQSRGSGHFSRGRGRGRGRGRARGRGNAPWTPERGTRDALYKLNSFRDHAGTGGDGMKELCDLVATFCSQVDVLHETKDHKVESSESNLLANV